MDEHEIVWPEPQDGTHPTWTRALPAVSQTYAGNVASGNSRVHYENVYHLHQLCGLHYQVGDKPRVRDLEEPGHAGSKRKRFLRDAEETPRTHNPHQTLGRDLQKLGKLSLSIIHLKEGRDAQRVAGHISAILSALTTYRDREPCDEIQQTQLEKLKDTVRWAERVAIKSVPQRKSPAPDAKAKTRRLVARVLNHEISLSTTVIRSQRTLEIYDVETFSTLRIEPLHASSGLPVAIFFSQQMSNCFTNVMHPNVTAYNRVPSSAEVFQIVQDDDLEGLQRLLACGSASLWDCDEMGRSLLHYACYGRSIRCCAFFVDNGADVDRLELDMLTTRHYITPLHCLLSAELMLKMESDVSARRSLSCAKVLLRSGADPTITPSHTNCSPLMLSFYERSGIMGNDDMTHFEDMMFRDSKAFIDLLAKQESGLTYWLEACASSWRLRPDTLQKLIDTGVDVAEVDDFGWNCLFQCVAFACLPESAKEFKALRSLLTVFDDIYATDIRGIDVFSYVNEEETCNTRPARDCGSYRQDLWYCAMKRSGLDARYDIAPCARIARYTHDYTPKHYWALCHLDFWNYRDFHIQVDHLLRQYPMTEEEMEITERIEEEWKAEMRLASSSDSECESESESTSGGDAPSGSNTASEGDSM